MLSLLDILLVFAFNSSSIVAMGVGLEGSNKDNINDCISLDACKVLPSLEELGKTADEISVASDGLGSE